MANRQRHVQKELERIEEKKKKKPSYPCHTQWVAM
jgi:hypothetical protein